MLWSSGALHAELTMYSAGRTLRSGPHCIWIPSSAKACRTILRLLPRVADFAALMYAEPELWSALLDALADLSLEFLRAQVAAGASAVQLYGSWVGSLSAAEYRDRVMPASAKVLGGLADLGVPRIHFGVGTRHLVGLMAEAGADVVVDWRLSLLDARRLVGPGTAVQGNLNPVVCFAPWEVLGADASRVIADSRPEKGHVFNLGHGVLPDTDPDVLTRLVELVHNFESSAPA
jgi:uroporphyrinogen decarboxylase